jgi:hypothetical protein
VLEKGWPETFQTPGEEGEFQPANLFQTGKRQGKEKANSRITNKECRMSKQPSTSVFPSTFCGSIVRYSAVLFPAVPLWLVALGLWLLISSFSKQRLTKPQLGGTISISHPFKT